jgi:beta-glucosidase-like glycosyl hydrolase
MISSTGPTTRRRPAGYARSVQTGGAVRRDLSDLGFTGVTITDSLDGTAHARGPATGEASAGTDMILVTGSEASTRARYAMLLDNATNGAISTAALRASYDRVLVLKASLT